MCFHYIALVLILTTAGIVQSRDCSTHFCSSGEYCFLETLPCNGTICPQVPRCAPNVCIGSLPFTDKWNAMVPCLESENTCATLYTCKNGYCCFAIPRDDGNGILPETDGLTLPNDLFEPEFVDKDADSVDSHPVDCTPCESSPCALADCPSDVPGECVVDKCSCHHWFQTSVGIIINCGSDDFSEIPNLPFTEGVDFPQTEKPILITVPSDIASTHTMEQKIVTVSSTPKEILTLQSVDHGYITNNTAIVDFPQTEKPNLVTVPSDIASTPKELLTLQSVDHGYKTNNTAILVVGACGVLMLLAAIGFASYRIYTVKVSKHKQKPDSDVNEVKVPLTDMSSNNNETKRTRPLLIGDSVGDDPSPV